MKTEGCQDLNLKTTQLPPGKRFPLGEASVTFVCGFYNLPEDWPGLDNAEEINARSIVVRLEYADRSVLFAGDTVGKHKYGDDKAIAAERFMVDNAAQVGIHSSVLVAPHHGGDNASTTEWIETVAPEYVIFSAGHKYEHPWARTVNRYLAVGIPVDHIFRTDLGDNEGGEEWDYGSSPEGHAAATGDVGIWIQPDGQLTVSYLVDKSIASSASEEPTLRPAESNAFRAPLRVLRPLRRLRGG